MDQTAPRPMDRIPLERHPMCDESSMIATEALEAGINCIVRLLNGRQTGQAIFAAPRTGKTHMINYFIEHHPTFLGTAIPCFKFRMWSTFKAPRTTRASFYTDVLRLLGYPGYAKGNAVQKFGDVIDLIRCGINLSNENRAILFVDEAQNLRREEYGFLMDIFNELRDHGIRLKVVLVGQPTLHSDQKELKGCPQIRARFMPRWFRMRGVTSRSGLARILTAIDDETEFPVDSGWSYTYYFLPQAYTGGFRLAAELDVLWSALDIAKRKSCLGNSQDFTMQTVMDFVTDLLRELSHEDSQDLSIDASTAEALARVAVQGQVDDELVGVPES